MDIEAAIRSGKGPGYERWAKVFNLKQLSQAVKKYFDEVGITKLPSVKSLREEYAGLLEQKRAAIASGNDLRGLGICHQQAFWQEYRERIPAKQCNLTEDCIACELENLRCFVYNMG